MSKGNTTSGLRSRVFVQKKCGEKWVLLGCLGLTGLVLDPRSLRYEICVNSRGERETRIIDQAADPRPFTLTIDGSEKETRKRFLSLQRFLNNGCTFNMLLAQLDCIDPNEVGNPYSSDTWAILEAIYSASELNFGNNTYVSLDDKNLQRFEMQETFAYTRYAFGAKNNYTLLFTVTTPVITSIHTLAVGDVGICSPCTPCAPEGCQVIYMHDDESASPSPVFILSTDGGQTTVQEGAAANGLAQAFDGKLFRVEPTAISVSADNGTTFTPASTDVAFAGLGSIARIDPQTYVVGGANGQVWLSNSGGSHWTRIRTGGALFTDYQRMVWDAENQRLYALGQNPTATATSIEYSDDMGRVWTVAGTTANVGPCPDLFTNRGITFAVVDGDLFRVNCNALGQTIVEEITVIGATGSITNVGGCENSCNEVFITVGTTLGAGSIFRSIDGGNSWEQEALPFTITGASDECNPIACCKTSEGNKMLFAFGINVYQGDPISSFFA